MKAADVFNNIITDNKEGSERVFQQVIQDKLKDALEVRKVGLTATTFNTTEEN